MTQNLLEDDVNLERIANLTFEQALSQLEKIVTSLETGEVPLAEAIKIYEKGDLLKQHCEKLLKSAEDTIEQIRLKKDGTAMTTESFVE